MAEAAAARVAAVAEQLESGTGTVRVVQVGLGPIGRKMLDYLSQRQSLVLTGAVDVSPTLIGQDVGTLTQIPKFNGIKVTHPDALLQKQKKAEVCIVTAVSDVEKLLPLLELCVRSGHHVISTCEQLAFPWSSHPELSRRLDSLSKLHSVSILATGINPGFLMDALPVFQSTICKSVNSVKVERFQDSRIRRLPFQEKIGAGLHLSEWSRRRDAGKIKHVGFPQSVNLIAAAFGWKIEKFQEFVEPVVATHDVSSSQLKVPPGAVAGVRQTAYGYAGGKRVITLELQAYHGLSNPHDTVTIDGEPNVKSTVAGGLHGDISTCAIVLNCIRPLINANRPGLLSMLDIPLPHFSS
jgi:4-hydroxy-tetrahydrodipicolinate reductase